MKHTLALGTAYIFTYSNMRLILMKYLVLLASRTLDGLHLALVCMCLDVLEWVQYRAIFAFGGAVRARGFVFFSVFP